MKTIRQAVWRVITSWPFILLTLLLTAQGSLAIALGNTVRGAVSSLLLPTTFFSILLAWIVARTDSKGRLTGGLMLLFGILWVYIRIGGLDAPLWAVLKHIPGIFAALINQVWKAIPPDFSGFLKDMNELALQVSVLTNRLAGWFRDLVSGKENKDSVALAAAWTFILWVLAAWSTWFVRQRKATLLGLLPTTGVLAYILYYTGLENTTLIANIGAVLLLTGVVHYYDRWQYWKDNRLDYYEYISTETGIAIVLTSLLLVSAAAYVPSISIDDIAEYFRTLNQPKDKRGSDSMGLVPDPDAQRIQVEYYRNEETRVPIHFLGTAPDLTNNIQFTVATGDLDPMPLEMVEFSPAPPRYYWRTMTYDKYNGAGWISTVVEYQDYPEKTVLLAVPSPEYQTVTQNVRYYADLNGQLAWTGTLVQVDQPAELGWRSGGPLHNIAADNSPVSISELFEGRVEAEDYRVLSILPEADSQRLLLSAGTYPQWIENRYLQLPEELPERIYTLARNLTSTAASPYERALVIEAYLRRYPYSLEVPAPPENQDVVNYFLFEQKEGFCDYYATSMVVLARAAGLPARFVIGYTSGEYDYLNARYIVRASHAHSWAEIYFSGIGWVQFEPTAGQPQIDRNNPELPQPPAPALPVEGDQAGADPSEKIGRWMASWIDSVPLVMVLVLVLTLAGLRVEQFLALNLAPGRIVDRTFRAVYRHGRRITGPPAAAETPLEFVETLLGKLGRRSRKPFTRLLDPVTTELKEIASLYIQSVYSEHPIQGEDARTVLKVWQKLRWRILLASLLPPE